MTSGIGEKAAPLLAFNPWAEIFLGPSLGLAHPSFREARSHAQRGRLEAGAEIWNRWAQAMLGAAPAILADPDTADVWQALAATDIAGVTFDAPADFAGLIFPGTLNGTGAVFNRGAYFNAGRFVGPARFANASFGASGAWFEGSRFLDVADFTGTVWRGSAEWRDVHFSAGGDFAGARFEKDLWISGSRFDGPVEFSGSTFSGAAGFSNCRFAGTARFSGTIFAGSAGFEGATVVGPADFSRAVFEDRIWLRGSRFDGGVDLTEVAADKAPAEMRDALFALRDRASVR